MNAALPVTRHSLSALTWRQLRPVDLQAMYALHLASMQNLGAEVVKPESRDFLASLLAGRGQVISAWAEDQLIAYGVLQHDLLPEDALPDALCRPHTALRKLAGAAVAPAWRGQGLQRQLIARRVALAPAQALLFSTASPYNRPSWHNLLAQGFAIQALVYRYGGHARYLMLHLKGSESARPNTEFGTQVAADDLPAQEQLLAQGWTGIACGLEASSIVYVPAQKAAP